jgi:hypothetical protein
MAVGSPELLSADLDAGGGAGSRARAAAHARIQETKHAEFHALDLVLDLGFPDSPVVAPGTGHRLPHVWLDATTSVYDALGDDFALVVTAGAVPAVPLPVVDLRDRGLRGRYGHDLLLVRPDQHVAWAGDDLPDPTAVLARARGLR